jgi:hypothetical protein
LVRSSRDEQLRWLEPAVADLDLGFDGFGVDDVDAAGDDGDVVNVTVSAGHAAVVNHDALDFGDGVLECDRDLALLPDTECSFVLGWRAAGEHHATDAGMGVTTRCSRLARRRAYSQPMLAPAMPRSTVAFATISAAAAAAVSPRR